jgi:hypothetical protein
LKNNSWKKADSQKNFIRRANRLGENSNEWERFEKIIIHGKDIRGLNI